MNVLLWWNSVSVMAFRLIVRITIPPHEQIYLLMLCVLHSGHTDHESRSVDRPAWSMHVFLAERPHLSTGKNENTSSVNGSHRSRGSNWKEFLQTINVASVTVIPCRIPHQRQVFLLVVSNLSMLTISSSLLQSFAVRNLWAKTLDSPPKGGLRVYTSISFLLDRDERNNVKTLWKE